MSGVSQYRKMIKQFVVALCITSFSWSAMAELAAPVYLDPPLVPASGTQLLSPGETFIEQPAFDQSAGSPIQVLFDSTVASQVTPYPLHLLNEAGEPVYHLSDVFEPVVQIFTSMLLASFSKSGQVFGKYMVSDGPYAEYIKASASILASYFFAAKTNTDIDVGASIVERSLDSLEKLGALGDIEVLQNIASKPAGYGSTLKQYLPKLTLLKPAFITAKTFSIRAQEQMYKANLSGDSVQLYDDDGVISKLADIHMIIPAASKNGYLASVMNAYQCYQEGASMVGEKFSQQLDWKSQNQPHIDIFPKLSGARGGLELPDSPYMKALAMLTETIPANAMLRLFPTVEPHTSHLSFAFGLVYLDESGKKSGKGNWIKINNDWGSSADAEWLTDRMARRALIKNKLQPLFHDYLWGDKSDALPVYNPMDADMLTNMAVALQQYLTNAGHVVGSCSVTPTITPRSVTIKQSGHYLAAVDAGGMVMYVDDFASQGTESPRVVMKIASIDEVDERVMAGLEEERINRYPVVLNGEKPFDPARKQMEMLVIKMLISHIVGNYADAGARASIGLEKKHYQDMMFPDVEESLLFNKAYRYFTH